MPAIDSVEPTRFSFTSADGRRIACACWQAGGQARGVVQIAHGLGEHIGRYAVLAQYLVQSGLTVYGNDHRGHGRTAIPPGGFGDFGPGGFNLLVEDMFRLTLIARKDNSGLPVILLGHSMGSFAAQQFAIDHSELIAGLVLSGSGALDGLVSLAQATRNPSEEILNAHFQPARTAADWLSRDPAVVDAFLHDPLCFGWLKPSATESFFAAAPRLADPANLRRIRRDLPIYAFSGSEDPVGLQRRGVHTMLDRYREAGVSGISLDFYPGGRHEMLNEVNRDEVRSNLLRWVSRVSAHGRQIVSALVPARRTDSML